LGAVLQINKKNTMEILGLSSVANLGWILLTLLVNTFIFIIFTLIYWTSLILIIATILKNKIINLEKNKTSQTSKIFIIILIANLAGLPPTTGFLVKWITLNEVIKTTKILTLLVTLTLIVRILNFYIYLRLFTNLMIKAKEDSLKNKTFNTKLLFSRCLAFVFIPILLVS
jgi:NADH-quinone oxidoreductase subunit N